LPEDELFSILHQIGEALDHAHTKMGVQPIVHGSLKLNNILIQKNPSGLNIFVSDFGLAKVVGAGAVVARSFQAMAQALCGLKSSEEKYLPTPFDAVPLSRLSASFLQSYAFLAPEQKRMDRFGAPVDAYAFGILSYYLITGVFPEGNFEMPSQIAPEYHYDWDTLVRETLHPRVERRRSALVSFLDEIAKGKRGASVAMRHVAEEGAKEKSSLESIVQSLPPPPKPVFQRVLVEVGAPQDFSEITESAVVSSAAREPILKEYHPEKKEARHCEPLATEMVFIEGGKFQRGSNEGNRDEMPRHQILLAPFAIDLHPVTNEQYIRYLEFMGGEKDQHYDLIRLKDSRINRVAGKLSIETGYAKHPVTGVTWYGAAAYAEWIRKRLPTEAEWEIACLGGESGPYPTGTGIEKSQANFFSSDTTPVMSYAPNGFGLYDMVGNVYEWCQDWYDYNYYEISALEPKNPKGPVQGVYRVLRGGCWKSLRDDLRVSHRHRNNPGAMNGTYGFRCASDL
jgi:formylglycine-generating enzyme required for sulfatase activity